MGKGVVCARTLACVVVGRVQRKVLVHDIKSQGVPKNMPAMVVAADVCQIPIGKLKLWALTNMRSSFLAYATSRLMAST